MILEDDVDFEAFTSSVESTEKRDAQANSTQKGFDFPNCVSVENKAIVRFVNGIAETALDRGKPGSGRAKLFNVGWVRDDDNKPFFLVLPAIINNKPQYNSTMIQFIDKVLSRTYITNKDPVTGEDKSGWKYFYEERDDYGQQQTGYKTLKQIFWNVYKSGVQPNNQFYKSQKSWRGQTIYVANVIDRLDYDWHRANKKTKLLMRSLSIKNEVIRHKEVSFYAIGTPLKELADNHGTKLDYDVLILPGTQPMDKFTLKNLTKLKEVNYWDDVKTYVTEEERAKVSTLRGFTEEEKTWDPIDIDKYYRFTSATTILKRFGKTIKAFDMMVGTNFYEDFQAEAAAESKVKGSDSVDVGAANTVAPQSTPGTEPVESNQAGSASAPVANPVPTPEPVPVPTPAPSANPIGEIPVRDFTEEPTPMEPSAQAQSDIDTFYSSL